MTENQIVQRCRQGDRDAQRELYAQTSNRIYQLLLRMTQNSDDAFDLAQETYLRVFRNIHKFRGTADIATWIYKIAINEARQFLRRRKLHERAINQPERIVRERYDEGTMDLRLDVEQGLAKLPEYERTLIVLRYFEGLSYDQMADFLEKPSGTIASGLNRAREMLRETLGPESSSKD